MILVCKKCSWITENGKYICKKCGSRLVKDLHSIEYKKQIYNKKESKKNG